MSPCSLQNPPRNWGWETCERMGERKCDPYYYNKLSLLRKLLLKGTGIYHHPVNGLPDLRYKAVCSFKVGSY